jgi:hypothetical protein
MALQDFEVAYSLNGVDYTALTNVVSISANIGRQAQLDQYNASTAQVVLRYPTGYASPITALVTGTYITIYNNSSRDVFNGRINNVEVRYGLPYVGGVGNADYLTLSVESAFAQLGRLQGLDYAMAADTMTNQMTAGFTETGLRMYWSQIAGGIGAPGPPMAATTISGSWGDWINRCATTTNARMQDAAAESVTLFSPFSLPTSTINFSDTTNNATNQVYDQIEFESLADNFYTQVTVDPESFAPQTLLKSGAVKPYRTLQMNTLNASTGQAADYASYLLSNYQTAKFAIGSISCLSEAQNDFRLDRIGTNAGVPQMIGVSCTVTFRGTVYPTIIEGVSVTATPATSRYTYYLSGADLNSYLLLNNATYGRLDYNKLGY